MPAKDLNLNAGNDDIIFPFETGNKLRGSKGLISLLLQHSTAPVLFFDAALKCTAWNPAMEQLSGMARARAIGNPVHEICPFLSGEESVKLLAQVFNDKTIIFSAANKFFSDIKNAHPQSYNISIEPCRTEEGVVTGGILFAHPEVAEDKVNEHDVEDDFQLSEAEKLACFGFWKWDVHTNEIKWSDNLYRLYGMEPGEQQLGLETFLKFVYPADLFLVKELIDRLQAEKKAVIYEHRITRKDGSIRTISGRSKPYFGADGKLLSLTGCTVDVTDRKEAERLLKEEKEFSENIINNSTYGIGAFNNELRFIAWNKYMQQLTGISGEMAIGRTVWRIFPGLKNPHDETLFEEVLKGKKVLLQERQSQDGKSYFEASMVPLKNKTGEIKGGLIILTDITARKEAEKKLKKNNIELQNAINELKREIEERVEAEEKLRESEARFRLLAENSTDMISRHDTDGRYLYASPASFSLLGYEPHELTGRPAYEFIHPDDMAAINKAHENTLKGDKVQVSTYRLRCKDGSYTWVESSARNIKDEASGEIKEIHVSTRNINVRHHAQEDLKQKNKELQQSHVEMEHFAKVISHDIREPLRMITYYTQLLEKRFQATLSPEANEFITNALNGAHRIQVLINDLLNYSELGMQVLELKSNKLDDMLLLLKQEMKSLINANNARITWDPLPEVKCSKKQISSLLYNLIENAIKFRSNKAPEIHISAEKQKNEWVFKVQDNGIGIDKAYAERIFVIFERLHDRSAYEGTGIGLAICKKIMDLHKGRIWFESVPGKGTTFFFTLPA